MSIIYFIVLIGVLIFVHELGHFLFAKAFDVKVLRFSIGIGPKIAGYKSGETEYVLCWLPLGGYVQMHGHSFESMENIDDEEKDRALMGKPLWQRSLIALAGPLFNILLPLIIFFFFFAVDQSVHAPVIRQVLPGSPAASAGFEPGDEIYSIDGTRTRYFHNFSEVVKNRYGRTVPVTVVRDGEKKTLKLTPEKITRTDFHGLNRRVFGRAGVSAAPPGPSIAIRDPDGPAARAGFQHFDRVVAIDGEPVESLTDIRNRIDASGGNRVDVTVLRLRPVPVDYGQLFRRHVERLDVEPAKAPDGGSTIGIDSAEMYVTGVDDDSPAARAGLAAGDRIVAVDGKKVGSWALMMRAIQNELYATIRKQRRAEKEVDVEDTFEITFERDGERRTTTLQPEVVEYKGEFESQGYRPYIGWGHIQESVRPEQTQMRFIDRMTFSAERSIEATWKAGSVMAIGIVRLVQGRISTDTVGGPIMIGELAAKAGRAGFRRFLQMMAFISINLALINLLPIPVLDGGHLMFYAIEAVMRRPLSFRARQIATYIGFVIIVFLMLLAFKNDIERNWQTIVNWLTNW